MSKILVLYHLGSLMHGCMYVCNEMLSTGREGYITGVSSFSLCNFLCIVRAAFILASG